MNIFGVRVDEVDLEEAVERILAAKKHPFFVVTPNPEQIVQAQEDEEFRSILNSADLAIPDGIGLRLAGVKHRVAGIELMEALAKTGKRVMYVGGKRGWPDLAKINKFKPDFLFVGLGAPKQEKWVYENLNQLKVGVVMVVGGAIDQLANPSLRPPKFMDQMGLGWLYRLVRQPWRVARQLRLLKFGWMAVKERFSVY
jgi:N-acetylglucosaminyldiphosphoundecaprenol N-acetyl-beta-D-mannosaminyltransferase